ncbi:MAG: oligosaccharide flippase family protein [Clostridia bacterium]|nr:oligosaccharide flippase family protein [Clostridia bacterium]
MADLQTSRTGNDAIKLTASKVIVMLVSLVSSMLLSRFRTLIEYGTYSQILMVINLVCSLLMLGLPNSINYFLAKAQDQNEKNKFLSVYYALNTLLSFVIGLVLVLTIPLIEGFFKNELIRSFWFFLALYPWTKIIMSSIENFLIVYQKTTMLIIYRVANSIALLGAILIVQAFHGDFMQYMLLFLATEIVFTVWTYILVKQSSPAFKLGFDKKLILTIFKFSIPIGLASTVGTLNIELGKLVITSFLSTEDLAVYTNASKELPVTIIATSMTAVLMPKIVRLLQHEKKEEAIHLWNSATAISFAFLCIIAVGCFVFAPEVVTILYSEKYLGGVGVFRIYCLVLLFRCTYFGMMLNATGTTKPVFYSSVGSLLLNISLSYVCFFIFGFIGPAVATLLSTVTMALYQLIYTCKKLNIRFRSIFPWKQCGIYLVINAVLGVAFYSAKVFLCKITAINPLLIAICMGCVWAAVFAIIIFRSIKNQWYFLNKER